MIQVRGMNELGNETKQSRFDRLTDELTKGNGNRNHELVDPGGGGSAVFSSGGEVGVWRRERRNSVSWGGKRGR